MQELSFLAMEPSPSAVFGKALSTHRLKSIAISKAKPPLWAVVENQRRAGQPNLPDKGLARLLAQLRLRLDKSQRL